MTATTSFAVPFSNDLASADTAGRLLAALTDEVAYGLIACDGDGFVRYANRSARAELQRGDALRLTGDVISLANGPQAALKSALNDASRRGRRRMLAVGSGGDRLMALAMPLQEEGGSELHGSTAEPALVLIILGRRGTCSALGVEMLAMLHGLTLAERRVLCALLEGDVPNRIALKLDVAVSTVRTHIKSIRDKVGVRSVEGLFIRAAEVPPISSALLYCESRRPFSNDCKPASALVAVPA